MITPTLGVQLWSGDAKSLRERAKRMETLASHPVVLAREAAALADLSEGRFELGLGSGYARREYERAGIPFAPRIVRAARLAVGTCYPRLTRR